MWGDYSTPRLMDCDELQGAVGGHCPHAAGLCSWAVSMGSTARHVFKEADFRSNIVYRLNCVPLTEMEVITVSICERDLI